MPKLDKPPKAYSAFMKRFPKVGEAWQLVGVAGKEGPLDAKCARLVKLGISIGMMREGAVHAGVRKAVAAGASRADLDQVVALAAGSVGFPSAVAVHQWVEESIAPARGRSK
jgi:4-carboxymuconolactone decarboxylase